MFNVSHFAESLRIISKEPNWINSDLAIAWLHKNVV